MRKKGFFVWILLAIFANLTNVSPSYAAPQANGEISPNYCNTDQSSVSFLYVIENTGAEQIKDVWIFIPMASDEFAYVSSAPATASDNKAWSGDYAGGGLFILSADSSGDYLVIGDTVGVTINVETHSTATATTWPAMVFNSGGAPASPGPGGMDVEIVSLSAEGNVSPNVVDDDQNSVWITAIATNTADDELKEVKITIPLHFSYVSIGAINASRNWSASHESGVVTLTPDTEPDDWLEKGEYVQLDINVRTDPGSWGAALWPIEVTGSYDGIASATEAVADEMKVQIQTLTSTGTVSPHYVYANSNPEITYRITNTGQSHIEKLEITIPFGFTFGVLVDSSASPGRYWDFDQAGTLITLDAQTSGDCLLTGEFLEIIMELSTPLGERTDVSWPGVITSESGGTKAVSEGSPDDLKMNVLTLSAEALFTPRQVYENSEVDICFRLTHKGNDGLKKLEITIPGGFTFVSTGTINADNWTKSWESTTTAGGTVVVSTAVGESDYLGKWDVLITTITVNTAGAQAPETWITGITGEHGGIRDANPSGPGGMEIEIVNLSAYSLVTPHVVGRSESSIPILHITTNTGTDRLKRVEITIPGWFSYVSTGPVDAGGKDWDSSYSGGKVILDADGEENYIGLGEALKTTITVDTDNLAHDATTWYTGIFGENGGVSQSTTATGGDMDVEIANILASGVIEPRIVDGGQKNSTFTFTITNMDGENIKVATITIPAGFSYVNGSSLVTASGGKKWEASFDGADKLCLWGVDSSSYIVKTESVTVEFWANTQIDAMDYVPWPAVVLGEAENSIDVSPVSPLAMHVRIMSLLANATAYPRIVDGGQDSYLTTYTIVNAGPVDPLTDSLTTCRIFIPEGFSFVSTGNVIAQGGTKEWVAFGSGSTVTLAAVTADDYLFSGEYVELGIYVQTQDGSQGATKWESSVTGSHGGRSYCSTATVGGMDMEIKSLKSSGTVTPGMVNGGQGEVTITYKIQNKGDDSIESVEIYIPQGFIFGGSVNISPSVAGKFWDFDYLSSTLTIFALETSSSIDTGEFVEAYIVVATQNDDQGPVPWNGMARGVLGGTSPVEPGSLNVGIVSLGADALLLPRYVDTSQDQVFVYTTTNTKTSDINKIDIYIPEGFDYISVEEPVPASVSKEWYFDSYNGTSRILTLVPNAGDEISTGEYVRASIKCQTSATPQAFRTWHGYVHGIYGGVADSTATPALDMQSEIVLLEANGLVSPDPVADGQNYDMTYQITNAGVDSIRKVEIYVPEEFTDVQFDTVTAPGGQNWSGSASGSTVTVEAIGGGDYVPGGQSVQVVIKVMTATGDKDPVTWNALVTGGYDGTILATELTIGDMDVDINTVLSTGSVTPHSVDGGQLSQPITCNVTNTGTDRIKQVIIMLPFTLEFTCIGLGGVTPSGWTGTIVSPTYVTVTADTPNDYIEEDEFVEIIVNVQTVPGPVTKDWIITATGESERTVIPVGDKSVEIVPLSAQALVEPDIVNGGQSGIISTYTVTNTGTDDIKTVEIYIPFGFDFVSVETITAGGKNWSCPGVIDGGMNGSTVTCTANNDPGDHISNGESIEVSFSVNTMDSLPEPATWYSQVTGNLDGIARAGEASPGSMQLEILSISANASAIPHHVYISSSPAIVYRSTNTGADSIKEVKVYVPGGFDFVSTGTITAFSGVAKNWSCLSVDDGGMNGSTVTLTANTSGDYISTDGFIEVEINVITQDSPQSAVNWHSQVTGNLNGVAQSIGNMEVEILSISADAVASPNHVYTGVSPAIVYRSTNTGTDSIKEVEIYVPPGFTITSLGAFSVSGGKSWIYNYFGSTVTLTANGPGNIHYITTGQYVEIEINVITQASPQSAVKWKSQVTGEYDGTAQSTEAVSGDMEVEIESISAAAIAAPHQVYTSASPTIVYRSTNTGTDSIQTVEICVPSGFTIASLGAFSASGAKSWTRVFSGSTVTLTANGSGNFIITGEYVEIDINVNTQASPQSALKWNSQVTGEYAQTGYGIAQSTGDMEVEILSISAEASATPHSVYVNASPTIVYRSTNTGTDRIKEVEIYVPVGFDFVSTGTISASLAKNWSCSTVTYGGMNGSTVTLTANTSGDCISMDGFVEVEINVITQGSTQLPLEWHSQVKGEYNATAQSTGDMEVGIFSLAARALVTPRSLLVNKGALMTYRVTNAGTDKLKKMEIYVPSGFDFDSMGIIYAFSDGAGKNWSLDFVEDGGMNGSTVTLKANGPGDDDYISIDGFVEAEIYVYTQSSALPPTTWYCDVTGDIDGVAWSTEVLTGDMLVELVALGAEAKILPPKVDTGQDDFPLEYTITNVSISEIISSTITIPPGFIAGSLVVTTVTVTGDRSWKYAVNGSSLNIFADTPGDYIYENEYVKVEFTCDIQETPIPLTTWYCMVGDGTGVIREATEETGGDTKSEIVLLLSHGEVTPHVVPKDSTDWEVTYYVENTGDDPLTKVEIVVPSTFTFKPSGGISVTASGVKIWHGAESGGVITLSADTDSDNLEFGNQVEAVFYIDIPDSIVSPSSWTSVAKGSLNGYVSVSTMSDGSLDMETVALYSTGTITPHQVYNNLTGQAMKYLITNLSTDRLKKIEITIPAGFTDVSLGTIDAGVRSWSGDVIGNTITLDASGGAADYLLLGEQIECNFYVITQIDAQNAEIFPLRVTGESTATRDCTEAEAGDMKVEIVNLLADASASPDQVYAAETVEITYKITSKGTDRLKRAEIYIPPGFDNPQPPPLPVAGGGKDWGRGLEGSTITLTANTTSDYLISGESVTIRITVDTQGSAQDPTTWESLVYGEVGDNKLTGDDIPDRDVEIMTISAYARVTPHQLDSGQDNQSVLMTVTNNATDEIHEIRIRIPDGFTYNGNDPPEVPDDPIKYWKLTATDPLVIFTADTQNDDLAEGQYMQVSIVLITTPAYQAPDAFIVAIVGAGGGAPVDVSGDLDVEIIKMRATASVSPRQMYSNESGQMGRYDVVYDSGTSSMKRLEVHVPAGFDSVFITSVTASGKSWEAEFSDGVITLESKTGGDWLVVGDTLSLTFSVTTKSSQAAVNWTSQVTSTRGAVVWTDGARQIEIVDLEASGEISPHIVNVGQLNLPLTIRIQNIERDRVKSFTLTIPARFSFASFGTIISSNSKVWSGAQDGNSLVFDAQSSDDYLNQGEWVQATIRVNVGDESSLPVSWEAQVTGAVGKTKGIIEKTPGSMEIQILSLEAKASVSPRNFDTDEKDKEITFIIANTGGDRIKKIDIFVPTYFSYKAFISTQPPGAKLWDYTPDGNHLTLFALGDASALDKGESISVRFTVDVGTHPAKGIWWNSVVTGVSSGTAMSEPSFPGSLTAVVRGYLIAISTATPSVIVPGGQARVVARLVSSTGTIQAGQDINFMAASGNGEILKGNIATTDAQGYAWKKVRASGSGIITVELYFDKHTSASCEIEIMTQAPDFSVLNSVPKGDVLIIKPGSRISFQEIDGLDIEYLVNKGYSISTSGMGSLSVFKILQIGGSWQTYTAAFSISETGPHTLYYRYVGAFGTAGPVFSTFLHVSQFDPTTLINWPNPFAAGREKTHFEYTLPQDSEVTLEIFDLFGQKVFEKEFFPGENPGAKNGPNSWPWNGKNNQGTTVANGGYIVRLTVKNSYGTKVFKRKVAVAK